MDYFTNRRRESSAGTEAQPAGNPPPRRPRMGGGGAPSYESLRAPSAIRIRRLPSGAVPQVGRPTTHAGPATPAPDEDTAASGRRRSSSAPQSHRPFGYGGHQPGAGAELSHQRTVDGSHMPAIRESETAAASGDGLHPGYGGPATGGVNFQTPIPERPVAERIASGAPVMHSAGNAAQRQRGMRRLRSNTAASRNERVHADEYSSDVIDLLDLIDPEVRTMNTLTNLQNSLFVPDLGSLVNRRPAYELSSRPSGLDLEAQMGERKIRSRAGTRASRMAPQPPDLGTPPQETTDTKSSDDIEMQEPRRTFSISSRLSDSRYAVLPHGVSLEGWSDEEIAELNDHVRHLLHSRREGFKRGWRGFKKYCSKPLGLFVVIYATLVTLFGAAWVFCLIGWIYAGSRQDYIIDVIDNILVALFALMGDGLAPFRAVDTYHMCFIAHYHHLTWRLRQEKQLPNLVDENDLPDQHRRRSTVDVDDIVDKEEIAEFSVLTPRQQKRLQYHQAKFNKSHTFYKPHETSTHHAFPLRLLVAVVVLLDCHSLFQVALGTCTWSIPYQTRPQALTATILSCSITCNIVAGVIISIGDHKTRKKDVLERIFRQGLTEEALKIMASKHDRGDLSISVDPSRVESQGIRDLPQITKTEPVAQKSKSQSAEKNDEDDFVTPFEQPQNGKS